MINELDILSLKENYKSTLHRLKEQVVDERKEIILNQLRDGITIGVVGNYNTKELCDGLKIKYSLEKINPNYMKNYDLLIAYGVTDKFEKGMTDLRNFTDNVIDHSKIIIMDFKETNWDIERAITQLSNSVVVKTKRVNNYIVCTMQRRW